MNRFLANRSWILATAFLGVSAGAALTAREARSQAVEQPAVACGLGHQRLCMEETTCWGLAGSKRCKTDYLYYNAG